MADAAVSFLLEKVSQLLKLYLNLIKGAQSEFENLEKDLDELKKFLDEAAQKPKEEETYRRIVHKIREVVYDVEDTIDACLTKAAADESKDPNWIRRLEGLLKIFSPKHAKMAKQVENLRKHKVLPTLEQAREDFTRMKIADGFVEQQWTRLRKAPLIRQDNVVGFDDQEAILLKYLNDETEKLDVISIVGMPGLGKTTLAWKIYQNRDVEFQFQTRIWIYLSQEFNQKDVFLNILKAFTNQDMSALSDHVLCQTVRDYLTNEKFLLVIDDVWTNDDWDVIRNVLPMSNKMGKVLITSRYMNVARHANVARNPHMLRFLTPKESWELLQLEVFGNYDRCPQELKEIGEIIAHECDGLPLAIVVIGGILVEKYSEPVNSETIHAWETISEDVSTYVKNDKENSISKIVSMSYNNLPNELRDCFLYLAAFPEDYEIPAWTLTRLWVAEGFVRHKEGQSLEETAEEHLKDLVNRNLVMVEKTNPDGEIRTCRVHDVIHVFCGSKAAEQNLFREIKMSKEGVFEPSHSNIKKFRRLCVHSYLSKFLYKKLEGKGIRSFLCFHKGTKYPLEAKHNPAIFVAFNLLRVLDSKSVMFNIFPMKLTELIHLRYITLCSENLDVLPEEMSRLWNLQTLVVDTNSYDLKIKVNLWKLIQLRHVKTKAAIVLDYKEGGHEGGENLQTLTRLSPEYCTEKVFDRAPNLKTLGIRGKLAACWNGSSLGKLDHLERLKLVNDLVYGSASENRLRALPQPNCFPKKLRMLTLSATYLEWRHMSTLGQISTLQVLKLKDDAFSGKSWNVDGGGFRSLKFLLIASTDLASWVASAGAFPQLSCLVLNNCQRLSKIPVCLSENLQTLNLERVAKSVVHSAREIDDIKKHKEELGFKLSIGPGCE